MKKNRVFLYLPAVVFEVLLIVTCVVLIVISPDTTKKIVGWVENSLPDHSWYFEGFTKE